MIFTGDFPENYSIYIWIKKKVFSRILEFFGFFVKFKVFWVLKDIEKVEKLTTFWWIRECHNIGQSDDDTSSKKNSFPGIITQ